MACIRCGAQGCQFRLKFAVVDKFDGDGVRHDTDVCDFCMDAILTEMRGNNQDAAAWREV